MSKINFIFLSAQFNIKNIVIEYEIEEFIDYMRIRGLPNHAKQIFYSLTSNFNMESDKYIIFFDIGCNLDNFEILNSLDKKYLYDISNKNAKMIVLCNDTIPSHYDEDSTVFKVIKSFFEKNDIHSSDVKFLFHESILDCDISNFNKLFIEADFFNYQAALIYSERKNHDLESIKNLILFGRRYYRPKHFLTLNNNMKEHRIELLFFLLKNKILDMGLTSWFPGQEPKDQNRENFDYEKFLRRELLYDEYNAYIEEVKNIVPVSLDHKNEGRQDFLNPLLHMASYFDIITESNWGPSGYDNDFYIKKIHITEKLWKPVNTMQPFIVISVKNYLKKLREWGFKTFEGWIDESYDELETYEDRKKVIYKEILRLCNMSKREIDDWYWELEPIIVHNFKHFEVYVEREYKKIENLIHSCWVELGE
jgi:hypothetical protein